MKKQIRKGTFETNSSSIHAICISKKHSYPAILPEKLIFSHDEFGWEVNKYFSYDKKASYLYEAILCCFDNKSDKLEILESILKQHGVECEFEPLHDDYYGGIDHCYELYEFVNDLLSDEDKLLTYLFGDSFIVTGNDNAYEFEDIMYDYIGDIETPYGTFPEYSDEYKAKFNNYDIYEKGN